MLYQINKNNEIIINKNNNNIKIKADGISILNKNTSIFEKYNKYKIKNEENEKSIINEITELKMSLGANKQTQIDIMNDKQDKIEVINNGIIDNNELGFLNNINSNIQTQIDNKQNTIVDNDLTISKTSGLQDKLDDIGILFQNTFNTVNELDNLTENNVLPGNVYYINENKRTYIVINNLNGDYKPNNWTAKSFLILVNYSELQNSIANLGGDVDKIKESLDFYISLNNNGTIYKGGNLGSIIDSTDYLTTNTPQIAFVRGSKAVGGIDVDINEIHANNYIEDDGVVWLKNNYITGNDEVSSIYISNINTANYISSGYSIVFYVTDFVSDNDGSEYSIFRSVTHCDGIINETSNTITHIMLLLNEEHIALEMYESDNFNNYNNGAILNYNNSINNEDSHSYYGTRYKWLEADHFRFLELDNPMSDKPNDIWFICMTFSSEIANNNYQQYGGKHIERTENNTFQLSYRRTSKQFLNQTKLLSPTFTTINSDFSVEKKMSRFFDEKVWFMFGCQNQHVNQCGANGDTNSSSYYNMHNRNYFNLQDYKDQYIGDLGGIDGEFLISSKSNISEMMILNKILNQDEINELSELSPIELKTRFR